MTAVYTWGCNRDVRLGGDSDKSYPVVRIVDLDDRPIKSVSAGCKGTAIITEDGELFVFGLFAGNQAVSSKTLARGSKIEGVSCGTDNIAFFTAKNQVWAWGSYLSEDPAPSVVHTFDKNVKVKQIACGATHCIVLTDKGVFGWGQNNQGQLGLGPERPPPMKQVQYTDLMPVAKLQNKHVIQVACGGYHSLVLTDAGEVYSFGAGGYGQLGTGNASNQRTPTLAAELVGKHITFIAAGASHSIAISKDGKAYLFGRTESGQCNTNAPDNACLVPVEVALNDEVFVSAAASYSCTYLVTLSGKIFNFGMLWANEHGKLDFKKQDGPLANKIAHQVYCGHYHAVGVFGEVRVKISPSTLLANIQTALTDTLHTDLALVTAHTTRQLHSVIVSLFCGVIAAACQLNKPLVDLHDELNDLTLPLEEVLIKYCYGISSELKSDQLNLLRNVAIKLNFPALVNDCEKMSSSPDDTVLLVPTFNLGEALGRTFRTQDEHSSDITFTFNNCQKKMYAHKIILTTRCEYFHGLFGLGMKESKQDVMHIDEWSCEAFESVLYFLYSDELSVTGEHAAEVLHIATRYLIQRLCDKCEEFIVDNITFDNVVELYQLSEATNATQIARGCHFFVRREVKQKDVTKLRHFDKLTVEEQEGLKMLTKGSKTENSNIQQVHLTLAEELPAVITNNNNNMNYSINADKKRCLIS